MSVLGLQRSELEMMEFADEKIRDSGDWVTVQPVMLWTGASAVWFTRGEGTGPEAVKNLPKKLLTVELLLPEISDIY